ncbi:putative toxin-antitoxin system toxin component, PIN family [Azospirillum sp.]|uniref:putative toxin-antitoxin system toxin component, PIN family n=1 Tax=Azospirillum sp. TaxID=34012 RepID=UPI002D4F3DC5|nr:putative toxin-antitoxin system toxin component, PIN family [Azospirillum sp.]HYD69631.1 putative toxin-antitoxin system toxin component, PIN family [Azospirillum sp.]
MNRPRVVIDTGVYVSALLKPNSTPAAAVQFAFIQAEPLVSLDCLEELRQTLDSRKLRPVIRPEQAAELLSAIGKHRSIPVREAITACRDPKDDKFLSLAVAGDAECIVSGDNDLLVLHPFRGVAILRPSEFLARYAGR